MTAFYQEIAPIQEPFDLGKDEKSRQQVVFNISTVKTASDVFLEELVQILEDASVGTFNVDIFASSAVSIPTGDGPYLSIVETGGVAPGRIQNQIAPAYPRPSAKIVVRAVRYVDARTMARAAYNALAAVRNQTVTVT